MIVRAGAARPSTIEELMSPALLARLDRLDVRSRKVFAGKLVGERRSKQRGRSVEFADYREYTPGDDIRFIDWNVYARLDRLFVRLFFEEQDLSLHVAIDASESMQAGGGAGRATGGSGGRGGREEGSGSAPTKLVFAQRLAMALGYIGLVHHNRVSMSVFGGAPERVGGGAGGIRRLGELRGRRNVPRVAQFVLEAGRGAAEEAGRAAASHEGGVGGAGGDFARAMRAVAATRRGKVVMVVISDFLFREGYEEGLRYLSAGLGREAGAGDSFDTYCLQVLAASELDPSLERGPGGLTGDVRLTDVEDGRSAEVTLSAALVKRYRAKVDEYVRGLASHCAARRMTHALLRSDEEVERVVMETLRRKGMVG